MESKTIEFTREEAGAILSALDNLPVAKYAGRNFINALEKKIETAFNTQIPVEPVTEKEAEEK